MVRERERVRAYEFQEALSAGSGDLLQLLDVVLGVGKQIKGLLHDHVLVLQLLLLGLLG
jgi:hypothetical protein